MLKQNSIHLNATEKGFSLLEILVAFAIMSISLGVLLQIFSSGMRTALLSDRYTNATIHAQSKLAVVGAEIPMQQGETEGDIDDIFRWKIIINPYQWWDDDEEDPSESIPFVAFEVISTVSWGKEGKERTVSLKTMRLLSQAKCLGC
ncbi:MAG: type II secretion system protein [Methylococcales bacterium]|jgi:general secretion pathway protein I|nr:type II secretion system protein [Methylococcales bacterium]MBT7410662.1 type II secretion system protein [Methylococcales bacterium]